MSKITDVIIRGMRFVWVDEHDKDVLHGAEFDRDLRRREHPGTGTPRSSCVVGFVRVQPGGELWVYARSLEGGEGFQHNNPRLVMPPHATMAEAQEALLTLIRLGANEGNS